jgi:hypothetical protein
MSELTNLCDRRVDAFVAAVNSSPRESLFENEVPPECVVSLEEEFGDAIWQIVPSASAEWLPEVESRLPFPLPSTFRSLIKRYLFPSFEVAPLTLFSVGVRDPESTGMEFKSAIFADRFMSPFLLRNGLLPFARPGDYSYDPVCFDFRAPNRKSEPAVVRIDHEEILCNERLRVVESISPAFHELTEEMTRLLKNRPTNASK